MNVAGKHIANIGKWPILALLCWLSLVATVRGDGGTPRFSGDAGGYRVTVFTEPTPLRAGQVDVSVLLEDRQSGAIVTDVPVSISAAPASHPAAVRRQPATTRAATNRLFQAATFELPEAGRWEFGVSVGESSGKVTCTFTVDVAPPIPRWVEYGFWIGWPIIPIFVFALHECRKYRDSGRKRQAAPVGRTA